MSKKKKNIVVLGAGFGGLRAAFLLDFSIKTLSLGDKYEVVLIDKEKYHTYSPLLYEVATVPEDVPNYSLLHDLATYDLRELVEGTKIKLLNEEVSKIDVLASCVKTRRASIDFRYLVLALGSQVNYFDIPGIREHSFAFKSFDDALLLRKEIFSQCKKKSDLSIVVGGGGPTGVELSSEIKNWIPDARVSLIQGARTILKGLDKSVVRKVKIRLSKLGVRVIVGKKIRRVSARKLALEDGSGVPFDVFVWTGGVRAVSFEESLPFEQESRGRIVISKDMRCIPEGSDLKIYGGVYAVGDVGCAYNPKTKKPVPLLAQVALRQANVVAHNIVEEIQRDENMKSESRIKTFRPKKEYSYILPVGGKFAVARIEGVIISGFFGWVIKGLVELRYLISIMPFGRAVLVWCKGLKMFVRNDNLG